MIKSLICYVSYVAVVLGVISNSSKALADARSEVSLGAYITVLAKAQKKDRNEFENHLKKFKACRVEPMTGGFSCSSCYANHSSLNQFSRCVSESIEQTKSELDFLKRVKNKKLSTSDEDKIRNQIKGKLSKAGQQNAVVTKADIEAFRATLEKKLDEPITVQGKTMTVNDYYEKKVIADLESSEKVFKSELDALVSFAPLVSKACAEAEKNHGVVCYSPEEQKKIYEKQRDEALDKMAKEVGFGFDHDQLLNDLETYRLCTDPMGAKTFECKEYDKKFYENFFKQVRSKGACEYIQDNTLCPASDGIEGKAGGVSGVASAPWNTKKGESLKDSRNGSGGKGIKGEARGGGGNSLKTASDGGTKITPLGLSAQKKDQSSKKELKSISGIDKGKCDPKERNCGEDESVQSGVKNLGQAGKNKKIGSKNTPCTGEAFEFLRSTSWLIGAPLNAYNSKPGKNVLADAFLCADEDETKKLTPWEEKRPCPERNPSVEECIVDSDDPKGVIPHELKKVGEHIDDVDANRMVSEHIASDLMQSYLVALEKVIHPPGMDEKKKIAYAAQKLQEAAASCQAGDEGRFRQNTNAVANKIASFNELALMEVAKSGGFNKRGEEAASKLVVAKKEIEEIDRKIAGLKSDFADDAVENFASNYPELLPCSQLIKIGAKQIQSAVNKNSEALCPSSDPDELLKNARNFIGPQNKKELEGLMVKKAPIQKKIQEHQTTIALLENSIKSLSFEKMRLKEKIESAMDVKPVEVTVYINPGRPLEARVWKQEYIDSILKSWNENVELLDAGIKKANEEITKLKEQIQTQEAASALIVKDWKQKICQGPSAPSSCQRNLDNFKSDQMLKNGISINGEMIFPPMSINGSEGDTYLCAMKATALKRLLAERAKILAESVELGQNLPIPISDCFEDASKKGALAVGSCLQKGLYGELGIKGGHNVVNDFSSADEGELYSKITSRLAPKSIEKNLDVIKEEISRLCENPQHYVEEQLYQDSLDGDSTYTSFFNCRAKEAAQRKDSVWDKFNEYQQNLCLTLNKNKSVEDKLCDYREKALQNPYRQFKKNLWKTKNAAFEALDAGACLAALSGAGLMIARKPSSGAGGAMSSFPGGGGSGFKEVTSKFIEKSASAVASNFGKTALALTLAFGAVEAAEYEANSARCRQAKTQQYSKLHNGSSEDANCNPAMEAAYNTAKGLFDGVAYDFMLAKGRAPSRATSKASHGVASKIDDNELKFDPPPVQLSMVPAIKTPDISPSVAVARNVEEVNVQDRLTKPYEYDETVAYNNESTIAFDRKELETTLTHEKRLARIGHSKLRGVPPLKPKQKLKIKVEELQSRLGQKVQAKKKEKLIEDKKQVLRRTLAQTRKEKLKRELVNEPLGQKIDITGIELSEVPFVKIIETNGGIKPGMVITGLKSGEKLKIVDPTFEPRVFSGMALSAYDAKTKKTWQAGHENDVYYTSRLPHEGLRPAPKDYQYKEVIDGKSFKDEINSIVKRYSDVSAEVSFPVLEEIKDVGGTKLSDTGKKQGALYLVNHYKKKGQDVNVYYVNSGTENHVFSVCDKLNRCIVNKLPNLQGATLRSPEELNKVVANRAKDMVKTNVFVELVNAGFKRASYKGRLFLRSMPDLSNGIDTPGFTSQKLIRYKMPSKPWFNGQASMAYLDEISDLMNSSDNVKKTMGQEMLVNEIQKFSEVVEKDIKSLNLSKEKLSEESAIAYEFTRRYYDPRKVGPSLFDIKTFLHLCGKTGLKTIKDICRQASIDYKIPDTMNEIINATEEAYRDTTYGLVSYKQLNSDKVYTNNIHKTDTPVEVGADYLHGKNVAHDPDKYPSIRPDEKLQDFYKRLDETIELNFWDQ